MAEYDDELDETTDGPADLRKALAKAKKEATDARKEREDMAKQLAELSGKVKGNTLAELLQAKGANPKAAKYALKDDVEATPEAVDAWLAENGEFFTNKASTNEGESGEESGTKPTGDMADLLTALQNSRDMSLDSSATPNATEQALLAKVAELGNNVHSEAEITAALRALGAPVAASGY